MKTFNILLIAIAFNLFALQSTIIHAQIGEIQGVVTDAETGETIPFVNVAIDIGGNLVGATTDFDGIYPLYPVPPGIYKVTFSYVGYETVVVENVEVLADKTTFLNVKLTTSTEILLCPIINCGWYHYPPLFSDDTRSGMTFIRNERGNFMPSHIR